MFEVRGVVRRYPGRPSPVMALAGVSLVTPPGRITGLLGPSGSGKSTLLRILAGFERPDEGEVRIGDQVVAGPGTFVAPQHRHVGIVTQEGSLFPHLDVAANVAYGLPGNWSRLVSPVRRRGRAARVAELLEMVGLPGMGKRRPDELSGGQQQRVALARALAPEPAAILLDEPFSALDTGLRVELREEVCALLRRLGTTTVLVTHDQGEALSLADHVVILRDGQVVQAGTPTDLYSQPADAATADLLGDVVLLPAVLGAANGATGANAFATATGGGPSNGGGAANGTEPVDGVALTDGGAGAAGSDDQPPCLPTSAGACGRVATCLLGSVPVAAVDGRDALPSDDGRCMVVLRPEQLRLDAPGVPARVLSTSFFGHDGMVRLAVDGLDQPLLVRVLGSLPEVGGEVQVRVAPDAVAHTVPAPA